MHEEDRRMKNAERDDADLSRCWPLSCASDVGAQPAILRPTPCTRCFSAKDGIDIGGRQSYGHPGQRLCGPVVPAGDVHVREAPDHQHEGTGRLKAIGLDTNGSYRTGTKRRKIRVGKAETTLTKSTNAVFHPTCNIPAVNYDIDERTTKVAESRRASARPKRNSLNLINPLGSGGEKLQTGMVLQNRSSLTNRQHREDGSRSSTWTWTSTTWTPSFLGKSSLRWVAR